MLIKIQPFYPPQFLTDKLEKEARGKFEKLFLTHNDMVKKVMFLKNSLVLLRMFILTACLIIQGDVIQQVPSLHSLCPVLRWPYEYNVADL